MHPWSRLDHLAGQREGMGGQTVDRVDQVVELLLHIFRMYTTIAWTVVTL